jgi:murein L,D-transpeptidase YcbB/YkuD
MQIDRRRLGTLLAASLAGLAIGGGRALAGTRAMLEAELAAGACGERAAALRGTLARMAAARPPLTGRAIVVDIPSQHLAAYEDGKVVLESRVVVGDATWKTPDLETAVTFVRMNPTWTVPESIVAARGWRSKLARTPGWFEGNNFDVEVDGRLLDPASASGGAERARRFVQRPGPGNALGRVKFGLAAGGAVYLHDTSDPDGFDEDARALSHGCVRVEEAMRLAAWTLGMPFAEARDLLMADDRRDRRPPSPVRVVTTYYTAWPDAGGAVRYYPDVYGRDGRPSESCPRGT